MDLMEDKSRIAAAIGELVVGSDAQGDLAELIVKFYNDFGRADSAEEAKDAGYEFLSSVHNLVRLVETCSE